jgi:hypothetical protein
MARGENPELIDDHPGTAPSKRIIKEINVYEKNKSTSGPNVVESIGIQALKEKCRHFSEWITKLEVISHRENSPQVARITTN